MSPARIRQRLSHQRRTRHRTRSLLLPPKRAPGNVARQLEVALRAHRVARVKEELPEEHDEEACDRRESERLESPAAAEAAHTQEVIKCEWSRTRINSHSHELLVIDTVRTHTYAHLRSGGYVC